MGKRDAAENEAVEKLIEFAVIWYLLPDRVGQYFTERGVSLTYLRKVTFRTYCEGYYTVTVCCSSTPFLAPFLPLSED